jgi:hypothetical protein
MASFFHKILCLVVFISNVVNILGHSTQFQLFDSLNEISDQELESMQAIDHINSNIDNKSILKSYVFNLAEDYSPSSTPTVVHE